MNLTAHHLTGVALSLSPGNCCPACPAPGGWEASVCCLPRDDPAASVSLGHPPYCH